MRKKLLPIAGWILLVLLAGTVAASAGSFTDPVPDDSFFDPAGRDYTADQVNQVVTMEQEIIQPYRPLSGYGVDPAAIPDGCDCDTIRFMRYRLTNTVLGQDPADALYADAGLLMVPGVVEGANGFHYLARHLVYQAYVNRGLRIEVWAMDRRANCLEDLTGDQRIEELYHQALLDDEDGDGVLVDPAEEAAILDTAVGYYYENLAINDKTFAGWYTSEELPFLAEFGLAMDTEDMYRIIAAMVPDPARRKARVFVGGHSLGGAHTSFFAGWDMDGDPATRDDAGYNNTAGLFCFDSFLTPVDTLVNNMVKEYLSRLPDDVIEWGEEMTRPVYQAALAGLRSGAIPRIAQGKLAQSLAGSPIGPEVMAMLEVQGLLAYALPDREHTALARVYEYAGKDVKTTLQKYISRDFSQFFWGRPDILDYRFTNEAMLGLFFDDNFTHIDMVAASLGFMYNGAVAEKAAVLSGGQTLYVPVDSGFDLWRWHINGPLYKWADFDEVARPDDPLTSRDGSVVYTTWETEMSGIQDLALALFDGPSNLVEWYFPIRKMVDMMAAITDYGAETYGLYCLYPEEAAALPQIAFVGGEGLMGESEDAIAGANHMDPMLISADTDGYRTNPIIEPLLDFVEANSTN